MDIHIYIHLYPGMRQKLRHVIGGTNKCKLCEDWISQGRCGSDMLNAYEEEGHVPSCSWRHIECVQGFVVGIQLGEMDSK